jgi:pimeloyl-ACP methyl ester carboxylesterase
MLLAASCTADMEISASSESAAPPDATAEPPGSETPANENPSEAPLEATEAPTDPAPPAGEDTVVIEGRYEFETADCEFAPPAGVDVTCGWMTVPQRWDDPGDPDTVRFHVARLHAPDAIDGAEDNPLVYLDGGPGGDSLEAVPFSYDTLFKPFNVNHDLVMWDQRGTGYGDPSLGCEPVDQATDDNLAVAGTQADELAAETEALVGCIEDWRAAGIDLSTFNSVISAHDLEAVRLALGIESWNVLGISYGTRLAQSYMRLHPQGIRSVIIDSVVPVAEDLDADIPKNAARAFRQLFEGCATDPACAGSYPDLEERFWALVAAMDQEPVGLRSANPADGSTVDVVANGDDLVSTAFSALYSTESFAAVPELVAQLEAGQTDGLGAFIGIDQANQQFFSVGVLYAVRCHEEYPFLTDDMITAGLSGDDRIDARFAAPGAGVREQFDPICTAMDAGAAAAVENQAVVSDLPTLVIEGQYDPVTPPVGGEEVAASLTNATYLLMPHQGHGPIGDECATDIALAFLAEPDNPPDTGCAAGSAPPPWQADDAGLTLEPFEYDDGLVAAAGLRPTGWTDAGPGLWANEDNLLNRVLLLQQAAPGAAPGLILDAIVGNTGAAEPEEREAIADEQGRTWASYRTSIAGGGGDLAIFLTEDDGATLVVLLQGPAARLDALTADPIPQILSAMEAR